VGELPVTTGVSWLVGELTVYLGRMVVWPRPFGYMQDGSMVAHLFGYMQEDSVALSLFGYIYSTVVMKLLPNQGLAGLGQPGHSLAYISKND